jgi:hypothetical protein
MGSRAVRQAGIYAAMEVAARSAGTPPLGAILRGKPSAHRPARRGAIGTSRRGSADGRTRARRGAAQNGSTHRRPPPYVSAFVQEKTPAGVLHAIEPRCAAGRPREALAPPAAVRRGPIRHVPRVLCRAAGFPRRARLLLWTHCD